MRMSQQMITSKYDGKDSAENLFVDSAENPFVNNSIDSNLINHLSKQMPKMNSMGQDYSLETQFDQRYVFSSRMHMKAHGIRPLIQQQSLTMRKQKARPKEVFLHRVKCECMAQRHELINNCLGCGKVVCAQQGEGNCLYCGRLVTRPDGLFIDDSEQLFPSLSKQEQVRAAAERSRAIQHKNKLVERDQSLTQGQNIFDEQMDYYEISENKWLDEGDRKKAIDRIMEKQQQVEEEERKTRITFDPLSGKFVRVDVEFSEEEFRKEGRQFLEGKELQEKKAKQEQAEGRVNWDQRMLRSEKMKDLCGELLKKDQKPQPVQPKPKDTKVTKIILEE